MVLIATHIFHSVSPTYLLLHVVHLLDVSWLFSMRVTPALTRLGTHSILSFLRDHFRWDEVKPAWTRLGIHFTLFEEISLHQCWWREIECHQPNIYKRCTTAFESYRRQTETFTSLYFGFGLGFERHPNSFKYFGNTSKLDLLRKIADSRFCSNKTFKQGTQPWFLES